MNYTQIGILLQMEWDPTPWAFNEFGVWSGGLTTRPHPKFFLFPHRWLTVQFTCEGIDISLDFRNAG